MSKLKQKTYDSVGIYQLTYFPCAYSSTSETENVDITMISESGTTAAVKLVDYSELDLIKVTGLTWSPALPASFVVSDVAKK